MKMISSNFIKIFAIIFLVLNQTKFITAASYLYRCPGTATPNPYINTMLLYYLPSADANSYTRTDSTDTFTDELPQTAWPFNRISSAGDVYDFFNDDMLKALSLTDSEKQSKYWLRHFYLSKDAKTNNGQISEVYDRTYVAYNFREECIKGKNNNGATKIEFDFILYIDVEDAIAALADTSITGPNNSAKVMRVNDADKKLKSYGSNFVMNSHTDHVDKFLGIYLSHILKGEPSNLSAINTNCTPPPRIV